MRVVALVAWSNGSVTMEEKGVYEVEDALATDLIAQGLCADAATYFGGGSGGGVLVVHETVSGTVHTLDKTWKEIHDALLLGHVAIATDDSVMTVTEAVVGLLSIVAAGAEVHEYVAESENGYPSYDEGSPV